MKAVLRHIISGKGCDAERQVQSRYGDWRRAQLPPSQSNIPRRTVADLYELAESAAAERRKREARTRKRRESERRRRRENYLRQVVGKAKTYWNSADAQARRGVALGYDEAVATLADLAEGYSLTNNRAEFERELQRFLAPHTGRRALLRRLTKAGLWSE